MRMADLAAKYAASAPLIMDGTIQNMDIKVYISKILTVLSSKLLFAMLLITFQLWTQPMSRKSE